MHQYMRMVMEMLIFITAVRTGNWKLHLEALEVFRKYLFPHNYLNYARMIPLHLAEMVSLKTSDPLTFPEFLQGNWVFNKNTSVPFCTLGADHGVEHINRSSVKAIYLLNTFMHAPSCFANVYFATFTRNQRTSTTVDLQGISFVLSQCQQCFGSKPTNHEQSL